MNSCYQDWEPVVIRSKNSINAHTHLYYRSK